MVWDTFLGNLDKAIEMSAAGQAEGRAPWRSRHGEDTVSCPGQQDGSGCPESGRGLVYCDKGSPEMLDQRGANCGFVEHLKVFNCQWVESNTQGLQKIDKLILSLT